MLSRVVSLIDLAGTALDYATMFVRDDWMFLAAALCAFLLRKRRFRFIALPGTAAPHLGVVIAVGLAWPLAWTAIHGVALPLGHDDYANLLAGDMLAHGHVAYPTHPFAAHFETMHVLQRPHYASKFFPGQGAVLAAGIALFHCPPAGMWLMAAAACAAVWWALRVWTTPSLALLGGLAFAIHPTLLTWGIEYSGGALPACAGALLLGATGVLRERSSRGAAIVAAVAAATLAYSRPFEGFVLTIAMFVLLLPRLRALVPLAPLAIGVVVVALLPLAAYDRAITGSAFVPPYTLYERQYDPLPLFVWQRPHATPPEPNVEMERAYRVQYLSHYRRIHEPGGMVEKIEGEAWAIRDAVFGRATPPFASAWLLLFVPLVAWPRAFRRDANVRRLTLALALFAFAPLVITGWLMSHYLAPAVAIAVALFVLMLRELATMRGAGAVFAVAACATLVLSSAATLVQMRQEGFAFTRQRIAQSLMTHGGKHVVIVAPDVYDAVYNLGDIDAQPVVWARDLGPARNAALAAYYRGRRVWYLHDGNVIDEWNGQGHLRPLPSSPRTASDARAWSSRSTR